MQSWRQSSIHPREDDEEPSEGLENSSPFGDMSLSADLKRHDVAGAA